MQIALFLENRRENIERKGTESLTIFGHSSYIVSIPYWYIFKCEGLILILISKEQGNLQNSVRKLDWMRKSYVSLRRNFLLKCPRNVVIPLKIIFLCYFSYHLKLTVHRWMTVFCFQKLLRHKNKFGVSNLIDVAHCKHNNNVTSDLVIYQIHRQTHGKQHHK